MLNKWTVFFAIIVSRITYAIEAWGSYVTMEQEEMINKMFKKGKKWGLTSKLYTLKDLRDERSDTFFQKNMPKFNPLSCPSHAST
jgi:hypothetical protein